MSLNIELQTETGKRLDNAIDVHNFLILLADKAQIENSCCLRFVDPYGNTIFNRIQLYQFVKEIDELINITENPEQKEVLARVKSLAERGQKEPHLYIKIIGD